MTGPVAAQVSATVQALKENANRLGLTWRMRIATVTLGDQDDAGVVMARYDGDTEAIGMFSMIGALATDQRVYVLEVPEAQNYVVGSVSPTFYRRRQTLTAAAASVTFSGIPADLASVTIKWRARTDFAGPLISMRMQINGSSGAVYFWQFQRGSGALFSAAEGVADTEGQVGVATGATAASGSFGLGMINLHNWDVDPASGFLGWVDTSFAGAASGQMIAESGGGNVAIVGPFTSITLFPQLGANLVAMSDFQLYGEYLAVTP